MTKRDKWKLKQLTTATLGQKVILIMMLLILIKLILLISVIIRTDSTSKSEDPKRNVNEVKSSDNDYYTSLIGIQNLVKMEQEIVRILNNYRQTPADQGLLELILFYLDEYLGDIQSMKKYFKNRESERYPTVQKDDDKELTLFAEEVSANPLRVFKLIRRFTNELEDIMGGLRNATGYTGSEISTLMNELETNFKLPTEVDLYGAADGLLRLQSTYQLSTYEMAKGILMGKSTHTFLSAFDMYFIGFRAFDGEQFATSVEWLYSAYQKVLNGDDSLELNDIKNDLRAAVETHNRELLKFKSAPLHMDLFNNLIDSNFSNIRALYIPPPLNDYQYGHKVKSIYDSHNFKALCRGEELLTPTERKTYRCFYSPGESTYNILAPFKFEILHEHPPVYQVYDLLSEKEMSHIKNLAFPHLKRAKVSGNEGNRTTSDTRTSAVAWILDYDDSPLSDKVARRISRLVKQLTGLEAGKLSSAEMLQISCYGGVGGYYVPHFDTFEVPLVDTGRGNRVTTVMFYLSNVELGGGTAFPRLGIAAKPVKGSAVIWHNLLRNGERDTLTLHGGCPVLYGNKWVANKWMRINDQFHVRKCTTNAEE